MNSILLPIILRLPARKASALLRFNYVALPHFFDENEAALAMQSAFSSFDLVQANNSLKDVIRSGDIKNARKLFDEMPQKNEVTWTTIIGGYVNGVLSNEALVLFSRMRLEVGLRIDQFVISLVLKACANLSQMRTGEGLHACSVKTGLVNSVFVGSALVDFYMKGYLVLSACNMFDEMPERNAVTWTALMTGLVQVGLGNTAIVYFREMLKSHATVDSFVFSIALKACADFYYLRPGKEIHAQVVRFGFNSSSFVANALASMYLKCGRLNDSFCLFKAMHVRNVVSWTTMIVGCVSEGYMEDALQMFVEMLKMKVVPNEFTFAAVISACSSLAAIEMGKQLHAYSLRRGYIDSMSVGNALVTMYSNCGYITAASVVFDQMNERDVVSWTAMVAGYCQECHVGEAFQVLSCMRRAGCMANEFTLSCLLSLTACMAMLEQGKQIHAHIYSSGLNWDPMITSALINMYSKCGSMQDASQVFCKNKVKDIISWTAMIVGYAEHGYSKDAIDLFEQMPLVGLKPDSVTFIGVLMACSHAGLLDQGFSYFYFMKKTHHIEPQREHYGCMIDLLCRAARLDEAESMIKNMPFKPDDVVLSILLRACMVQGNIECGKRTAECILELDPDCAGTHITLSNIYAASGKWKDSAKVRKSLKEKGVKKEPGWSWIMVKDRISTFMAGDRSHPQSDKIYAILELLMPRTMTVLNEEVECGSDS
ncbi:putative pentatricopeptide repeat-containing protein At3g47840 [Nymphaea colorata]|nr:putative pentatricopeptide repeat-containing protein At3g47840 [Nymphaea colorata]XP_049935237.1 putative pentatricopeptide repeat-containing protein At3g47840 [Nymphaea colorata]XP_049935238.1 putative pentatricopeptide repeat-containing protein At3g47840 [Nymphaea colorata]XP_049935239.1 putative pentatricopeptide repeat-containing protein At3g47840 [Nymphaea colorata]XP_049935240.1 putative pentatricopeptide repeat-containing protein At3g47840 [Nymphaea colorata]XP_049935241.1 putative p